MTKQRIMKKDDLIRIKEPIVMRIANSCETKDLFTNINRNIIYIDSGKLIIENPSSELMDYVTKWLSLIYNPNTGICEYCDILNLDRHTQYEYLNIINLTQKTRFNIIPEEIVCGKINKLIFRNILM